VRSGRRVLTALLAGLALVLLGAGPASAHSGLSSTLPGDGAQVEASPAEVVLEFDEPVSTRLSRVQVTGPGGDTWQTGAPDVSGSTVRQPLAALGPAGTYEVAYRVVSADGHPVSGTSSFTLTAAGTGTAPQQETAGDGGGGSLPVLPLAVAALVAGAGAVLVLRRRQVPVA
jgi:copper resistance protein C